MLVALGAMLIDTDLIARQLTLPGGAAIAAIRAAFGADFIAADGSLDRARMRGAAFADAERARRLEAILHPLIGVEVERQAAAGPAATRRSSSTCRCSSSRGAGAPASIAVWVVDCDEAVQVERVAARPGWSDAAARAVIAQQATRRARRAAADAVIDNDVLRSPSSATRCERLWAATVQSGS